MVCLMFFSIHKVNLSASDFYSTEAARLKSKNRHIRKIEIVPLRLLKMTSTCFRHVTGF